MTVTIRQDPGIRGLTLTSTPDGYLITTNLPVVVDAPNLSLTLPSPPKPCWTQGTPLYIPPQDRGGY